jgi:hypothetical protein
VFQPPCGVFLLLRGHILPLNLEESFNPLAGFFCC